ncbi:MAG: L,D-transpeptidase family protein [Anaerolineae bacterium]|nr:L,D-transpeptidase family protein [Anaerolineae bacterium]
MDLILIVALLFFVIMPPTQHFVKYTPPPSSESSSPLSTLYTPAASSTPEPSLTSTFYFTPSPAATPTFTPSPRPAVPSPTPTPHRDRKWIEVSLRQQKLVAYEDGKPVFEALVSTGLARSPTVTGRFRIYLKLLYSDMSGPGYYFRKVPYVMYFYRGYALHGTYWHNNFGRPMSRGCVNLRIEDARWLFNWTDPPLPPGASFVYSSPEKPGTLVIIYP